jgi:hypothetical protein
MSEQSSVEGRCLCGAVTMTVAQVDNKLTACHCEMCRRWGGGPLLAVGCDGEVQIQGEEAVGVYDSSPWAERGFCKTCGTHLFYRIKQAQQYHLPLGLFGDAVSPTFIRQYFIDKKPGCYTFAEQTEDLTEAQVFELFAPKD